MHHPKKVRKTLHKKSKAGRDRMKFIIFLMKTWKAFPLVGGAVGLFVLLHSTVSVIVVEVVNGTFVVVGLLSVDVLIKVVGGRAVVELFTGAIVDGLAVVVGIVTVEVLMVVVVGRGVEVGTFTGVVMTLSLTIWLIQEM